MMLFLVPLYLAFFFSCASATAPDVVSSCFSEFYRSDTQHCRNALRHIEGGGIGYNQGYTTLEGFLAPYPEDWVVMPFVDLRGHIFNNGNVAANVGIGVRGIAGNRVYGFNAYYDYREVRSSDYDQVGLGFETLGQRWDFRVNGYLPVGTTVLCPCPAQFVGFCENAIIVSQKNRFAMKGINAELGVHFGKSRFCDFYAEFSPYFYKGDVGPNVWGGKARAVIRFEKYFSIALSDSYDKMFRNRFQAEFTFTIPLGRGASEADPSEYNESYDTLSVLCARMVQPVERQEIIVEGCYKKCSAALDPLTDLPFNVLFVDNTSNSRGTYESPYPTLFQAQVNSAAHDVIYVFPGNGTTQGMDQGITLKNYQKFWGSGVDHTLSTVQGTILIPAQTATAPQMTNVNSDGDGITLAPINEVRGFTLTDVAGNGILGLDLAQSDISACTIDHSTFDQIHLEYSGAQGNASLDALTLTNGGLNGILIDSTASSMACTVSNSTMQGNALEAMDIVCAEQATLSVIGNTMHQNNSACIVEFNGPSTMLFSGNACTDNQSVSTSPVTIIAGAAPLTATIQNNSISTNVCGALRALLNDTDAATLNINDNSIADNGSGSLGPLGAPLFIGPNSTSNASCQIHMTGNTLSNNSGAALYCFDGSYIDLQVNASGNTLTDNDGGLSFANPCSTFTLVANNNVITNNSNHGITTSGGIVIDDAAITITNNQINNNTNGASGIALAHEGINLDFVVTNNTLSDNDTSGIIVYASTGAVEAMAVTIENNTMNNNQNVGSNAAGGIDLEQYVNLSGTIANNTLLDNVGAGLYLNTQASSPSVCVTLSGNNSNTGYTLENDIGTFNVAPCDYETVNTGVFTLIGTINAVTSCPSSILCPA